MVIRGTRGGGGNTRKGRGRRLRITEALLWIGLASIGGMLVAANLWWTLEVETTAAMQRHPLQQHYQHQHQHDQKTNNNNNKDDDKQPLLEILKLAGVTNLTAAEKEGLPGWSAVTQKFGEVPRILGLETCGAFQEAVPQRQQRFVAPAGAFNSGTNLLHAWLSGNCVLQQPRRRRNNPNRKPKPIEAGRGIDWQVNWGKHQSPRFRSEHHVDSKKDNHRILPVVLTRDPWGWFQSMCKTRYSAHWFHVVPHHCPNFVPNEVEREWFDKPKPFLRRYYNGDPWKIDNVADKANFTLDSTVVPVRVRYKKETVFHESLAHFWKDWYQEYYEATPTTNNNNQHSNSNNSSFPRLMVRLEDLVFHPNVVLKTICDCAGGRLLSSFTPDEVAAGHADWSNDLADTGGDGPGLLEQNLRHQNAALPPVVLTGDTAKQGGENVHGTNQTNLLRAMSLHVHANRTKGMTPADRAFAEAALSDSPVREAMGYRPPA